MSALARWFIALAVLLTGTLVAGQPGPVHAAEEPVNLAPDAEPSAEYTAPWNSLAALNDGTGVTQGGSHGAVWGSYSGTRPATRWVQYEWLEPVKVSATEVLFWHDAQPGTGDNVAVPKAWSMSYWDDATEAWRPVPSPSAYGTNPDAVNRTTFGEVTTTRVRIELQASPNPEGTSYAAVAISEWAVFGIHDDGPPPNEDDPVAVDEVHIPTTVGTQPELPSSITVTRLDGHREDVAVVWEPVDAASLAAPGSVEVAGEADGVTAPVHATVWVRAEGGDGGGIVAIDFASALTIVGVEPDLPSRVTAVYDDGTKDSRHEVTWRAIDPSEYAEPGIIEISGTVAGTELEATLLLVVDVPAPTEDAIAPVVAVSLDPERPSSGWWTEPVTASFAASDAVDPSPVVEIDVDGAGWTAATGPLTVDTDGAHTLHVRASDQAGNVSTVQELEIGVDTVAPEVMAAVEETDDQATITLEASDATSGVATIQYAVGEEFEATYMGPIVVDKTDVEQTVRFTATDEAGNEGEPQILAIPALTDPPGDTEAPEVTVSLSPVRPDGERGWFTSPVRVVAGATDAVDPEPLVEASLDGAPWKPASDPIVIAVAGAHTLRVRAVDAAGNRSDVASRAIRLDPDRPKARAVLKRRQRVVRLSASDATSGVFVVQYRLDGGRWRTYREPVRVGPDKVRVRYRAVDRAGNVSVTRTLVVPRRGR